jgi:hypothetical protein
MLFPLTGMEKIKEIKKVTIIPTKNMDNPNIHGSLINKKEIAPSIEADIAAMNDEVIANA